MMAVRRSGAQAVVAAAGLLAVVLTVCPPDRLSAQVVRTDSAAPKVIAAPADSLQHIGPMGAFWRSFLLPGWGQAATGRNVTGALFTAWEGLCVYMTLKAVQERNYLATAGGINVDAKKQEIQDWAVLWGFNHLFAGAEAYVSAHLHDFPKDLKIQAVPGGVGLSLPLPHP